MKKIILFTIMLLWMSSTICLAMDLNETVGTINSKIKVLYDYNHNAFILGHPHHGVINVSVPTKMLLKISFKCRVEALKSIFDKVGPYIQEVRMINERNTIIMYIKKVGREIELLYLF